MSSMTARKMNGIDRDSARQGAIDMGRSFTDQTRKTRARAERIDQRKQGAEGEQKRVPEEALAFLPEGKLMACYRIRQRKQQNAIIAMVFAMKMSILHRALCGSIATIAFCFIAA